MIVRQGWSATPTADFATAVDLAAKLSIPLHLHIYLHTPMIRYWAKVVNGNWAMNADGIGEHGRETWDGRRRLAIVDVLLNGTQNNCMSICSAI